MDLRDATHEQAVSAIKNAANPVRFVLQSLHTNQQNMINSASNSTVGSVRFENAKPEEILLPEPSTTVQITPLKPMMTASPNSPKTAISYPPPSISTSTTTSMESESKEEECSSPEIQRENTVKRRSADHTVEKAEEKKEEKIEVKRTEEPKKEQTPSRKVSAKEETNSLDRQKSVESKKSVKSVKKRDSIKKIPSNETAPLIISDVSSSETHEDEPPTISPSTSFDTAGKEAEAMTALGIDEDSAAFQIKNEGEIPSKFFYTLGKIERKYDSEGGELVMVACERPESGLGISLAGNK